MAKRKPAPEKQPRPDDALDIVTAAAIHNVSTRFVRRRIADGRLPAYRVAGTQTIRIRRADIDALRVPVVGAR
jgi:excisionase family DNA binding protein